MALKKRKPFILNDKEAARKEYTFSKLLTLSLVFSAFIVPLINDCALSLFHSLFISGDYTLKVFDVFLSYLIPLITVSAAYFSYAAVVLSIYCYGVSKSSGRMACLFGGVIFLYLISYICTCIVNGYVMFDVADEGSFVSLIAAIITCIFVLAKDAVLVFYTHMRIKKFRRDENVRWLGEVNDENKTSFIKRAFGKNGVNLKIAVHFFSVSLACDLIVRTASTYMDIASAGAPEEFSHYLYFAEQYALAVVNNVFGFAVMVISGALLGKYVTEKEEKAYPYKLDR